MIRANDMVVFDAVAATASMTEAAARLGVTKQTVSQRVAGIEETLGVRLLERTTRSVRLTEAGRVFAEHCRAVAARVEVAVSDAQGLQTEPSGLLRVSLPVLMGRHLLPELLVELERAAPKVRVEAVLADRFVDLVAEGFDAAVRVGPLEDSTLVARRIGRGRLRLVASPSWIAAHGRPAPAALAEDLCITQRPDELWPLDGEMVRVSPRLVVNDIDAACAAAAAGLGVARIPSFVADRWIESGALEVLYESELSPPLYVVMPSRAYVPAKVRVFVELVAAQTERVFG